jgi:hypothetical protein
MRVPLKDDIDRVSVERLLEPARAEVRENVERLAFNRAADGRVVQQGDPLHWTRAIGGRR